MMMRALVGLVLFCTCFAVSSQEVRARHSTEVFIAKEIFDRVEAADGLATITVGKNFSTGDRESQQDVVKVSFEFLQSQDPTIQQIALIDTAGRKIGEYSKDGLTLQSE